MSSIAEIGLATRRRRPATTMLEGFKRYWWRILEAHRASRLTHQLSRMDSRLLKDMGFDPVEIRAAVRNSWDEIEPGRYHPDW